MALAEFSIRHSGHDSLRLLRRLGVVLGSELGLRLLKPFAESVGPLAFADQRPLEDGGHRLSGNGLAVNRPG
jgi:hypothetical protein